MYYYLLMVTTKISLHPSVIKFFSERSLAVKVSLTLIFFTSSKKNNVVLGPFESLMIVQKTVQNRFHIFNFSIFYVVNFLILSDCMTCNQIQTGVDKLLLQSAKVSRKVELPFYIC